jgi:hypothetical protein
MEDKNQAPAKMRSPEKKESNSTLERAQKAQKQEKNKLRENHDRTLSELDTGHKEPRIKRASPSTEERTTGETLLNSDKRREYPSPATSESRTKEDNTRRPPTAREEGEATATAHGEEGARSTQGVIRSTTIQPLGNSYEGDDHHEPRNKTEGEEDYEGRTRTMKAAQGLLRPHKDQRENRGETPPVLVSRTEESATQPTKQREYLPAANQERGGVQGYSQDDDEHLPPSTDAANQATNIHGAATNISDARPTNSTAPAEISAAPAIISGPPAIIPQTNGCTFNLFLPLSKSNAFETKRPQKYPANEICLAFCQSPIEIAISKILPPPQTYIYPS